MVSLAALTRRPSGSGSAPGDGRGLGALFGFRTPRRAARRNRVPTQAQVAALAPDGVLRLPAGYKPGCVLDLET